MRDQGFLRVRGPPDGRPGLTRRTARRWWASGAWPIALVLVLYLGSLGARGPHLIQAIGAPPAITAAAAPVAPAAAPHHQLGGAAELFCHGPGSEPGEGRPGGAPHNCALCQMLCGGGGGPALLPPDGDPSLRRFAAARRRPPPRAAVVTRPHPVASGGGPRAPPSDS